MDYIEYILVGFLAISMITILVGLFWNFWEKPSPSPSREPGYDMYDEPEEEEPFYSYLVERYWKPQVIKENDYWKIIIKAKKK